MNLADLRRLARPALAAAVLAASACSQGSVDDPYADIKVDPYLQDVVMGDASAPVEIVEFASLSCPHCRDFWKQELPRLKSAYIDTGKVRYVLKDFPTPPVELAVAATAIARCAGPEGYYDVVDDVYTHFHDLMDAVTSSSGAAPVLVAIGSRHGLTPDEVGACANNKDVQTYINGVIKEASDKGITSTPTIFVNGNRQDAHDFASLSAVIDGLLGEDAPPAEASTEPPAE